MAHDDPLSALLKEWQPTLEPGPGFHRGVWSRIEAAQRRQSPLESALRWIERVLQWFEAPRVATAALVLALLGGVLLGRFHSRASHEERYLDSLKLFATVSDVR